MGKSINIFEQTFKKLFKPVKNKVYNKKELKLGKKTETEHTDIKEIATIIAKHHLTEDPKYYSKLKKVHDEDENVAGGASGAFGPAAGAGHGGITNTDWYAPGDARVPKALGVYSRRGKVNTKKKKTRRKNKKKK
jgi:hypothetical protein|tara:strand:+ start:229 stop:633 length:405 start_codon:yes stop_codon:yes gene_type:complete